jgi:DNA modification methylase
MLDIPGLPGGCFAQERILNRDGSVTHPTQKPTRLMNELLAVNPMSVLDPFMGSGTTGVACVKTGRNFIGIEIDEGYYKIAERRIEQAQYQLPLLEVS